MDAEAIKKIECYKCYKIGYYKSNYPKLTTAQKARYVRQLAACAAKKAKVTKKKAPKVVAAVKRIAEDTLKAGVDSQPALYVRGEVDLRKGNQIEASFCLDDAADINVVAHSFVKKHNLLLVKGAILLNMESFYRDRGRCYSAYTMRLHLANSYYAQRTSTTLFYAIDIEVLDFILGCLQRQQNAIIIDSSQDSQSYSSRATLAVYMRELREFVVDLQGEYQVFTIIATSFNSTLELLIDI